MIPQHVIVWYYYLRYLDNSLITYSLNFTFMENISERVIVEYY